MASNYLSMVCSLRLKRILHVIIERMFNKQIATSFTIFVALVFSLAHMYTPVVRSVTSHSSSHSSHFTNSSCQTVCYAAMGGQQGKLHSVKKFKKTPVPEYAHLNQVAIDKLGIGLLQPSSLWRQSSWVPPDIVLLSGHHTTDL